MIKYLLSTALLVLIHTNHLKSQILPEKGVLNKLSLLFVGDVMGHGPQIQSAYDSTTNTYNYDSVFYHVSPVFNSYDLTLANLEVTLGGQPYTGYPQFSSPDELALSLKNAGVDILVTANNHSVDRGKNGIIRTIKILDSLGIQHTGTFLDSINRDTIYPLIIKKNGLKIALLNYTYGTNGLTVPKPTIVNLIDTLIIKSDFDKCKAIGVDDIIVFFHWGLEYERTPNAEQKKLADFCHNLGIRIVIGSHPHVIQMMEATLNPDSSIKDITVYSLGNFVSNQRGQYRNGGVLASLTVEKDTSGIKISSTGYHLVWVHTPTIKGKKVFRVLPVTDYESKTDYFSTEDKKLFDEFAKDSRELLQTQNKYFNEVSK